MGIFTNVFRVTLLSSKLTKIKHYALEAGGGGHAHTHSLTHTHTHTHNLSRNSLIVFTVLGHAYTRRNLIRGQTPIGLYACGWHTMSCANEGAKVPDVSCLYNDNEGAQVQVKHAWVHLQHVGPNWRLHQADGGYSSLPECRCVCM